MKEYIVEFGDPLYNEETGEAVFKPKIEGELIRCKDCKRWNTILDIRKAEYGLCQARSQLEATARDHYCGLAERKES